MAKATQKTNGGELPGEDQLAQNLKSAAAIARLLGAVNAADPADLRTGIATIGQMLDQATEGYDRLQGALRRIRPAQQEGGGA